MLKLLSLLCLFAKAQFDSTPDFEEEGMQKGRCPLTKDYNFDVMAISHLEYKLIYGDTSGADGSHCGIAKFVPHAEGTNATRWNFYTGQKLDLNEISPEHFPEKRKEFLTFYDDEMVLVFRDQDTSIGITNEGHVFLPSDFKEEHVPEESPYNFKWRILQGDEDVLIMYSCREEGDEINAAGQNAQEVRDKLEELRQ